MKKLNRKLERQIQTDMELIVYLNQKKLEIRLDIQIQKDMEQKMQVDQKNQY